MNRFIVSRVRVILVVIIVMGLFWILSSLTPLYADDFTYSYSFADGFGSAMREQKITSISSLIQSQIGHYKYMNGRIIAHTLAQAFLVFDKGIFDIVNSVAFALLGMLICYHTVGMLRKIKALDLIATYTTLFLLAPSFGQSYLWLTGSCNYLFTFVLVLLFLIPYRACDMKLKHSNVIVSIISAIAMFAFGVVAGNTNENTGVSLAVMLLIFVLFFAIRNHSVSLWMITGWLGTIGGAILSITAGGNSVRTGGSLMVFSVVSIVKSTISYTASMLKMFSPLFVLIAISVSGILLLVSRKRALSLKLLTETINRNFYMFFYGLFFLGSVYAMTIPAQFPHRAWSHPLALLIIATFMLFRKLIALCNLGQKERKVFAIIASLALIVTSAAVYSNALPHLRSISIENNKRIALIHEAKKQGEASAKISSIVSNSSYTCFDYLGDISDDKDFWINQGMAKFYGIQSVEKSSTFFP